MANPIVSYRYRLCPRNNNRDMKESLKGAQFWRLISEETGETVGKWEIKDRSSLNIREFTVHVLLKPGLENFEHYFTSV